MISARDCSLPMNQVRMTQSSFKRDRFTWLAYFGIAFFAYTQALHGLMIAYLRDELHISFTVSGFHLTAFAVGMVFTGLSADQIAARFGRRLTFWGGALGMAVGAALLITGQHPALTIGAAFIEGVFGTLLLVMVQSTLADRHQEHRATPLTEANVGASIAAALAPISVSVFERIGMGWRGAYVMAILYIAATYALFRKERIPEAHDEGHAQFSDKGPLPAAFWPLWWIIFLGVAVEWCIMFWGASFLETAVGLSKVNASTTMSAFFVAMVIGRVVGSRLTQYARSEVLLVIAVGLVVVGFPISWLVRVPLISTIGLFVTGLGQANVFPLALSAASSSAPNHVDKASARVSLSAGLAILIVPQVLGSASDAIGIENAYGIILLFAVVVFILALKAQRRSVKLKS